MTKRDQRHLHLFVAFAGDVPFRDERKCMSTLMVALGKQVRPIEWISSDARQSKKPPDRVQPEGPTPRNVKCAVSVPGPPHTPTCR